MAKHTITVHGSIQERPEGFFAFLECIGDGPDQHSGFEFGPLPTMEAAEEKLAEIAPVVKRALVGAGNKIVKEVGYQ